MRASATSSATVYAAVAEAWALRPLPIAQNDILPRCQRAVSFDETVDDREKSHRFSNSFWGEVRFLRLVLRQRALSEQPSKQKRSSQAASCQCMPAAAFVGTVATD